MAERQWNRTCTNNEDRKVAWYEMITKGSKARSRQLTLDIASTFFCKHQSVNGGVEVAQLQA